MKINDINESKQVNELDLSPLIGSYGKAKLDSVLGNNPGAKNIEDRMAMDSFIKKFIGNATNGIEQAVASGLVAKGAGQTTPQATPQTAPQAQATAQSPEEIRKQKLATNAAAAQQQMAANPVQAKAAPAVAQSPAQIRQQKQAVAAKTAQGQMAPMSKLPANQPAVQAGNIRQQKQAVAAKAAQGQMTPKVAGPTPKTPEQIRQAKQAAATAALQGQMNPASKLPADQFAKSADNVRQQQQATATQTAQQQMAAPKQVDPRFPNGKFDGVTGKPTPEYQKELDKSAAAQAEKDKAAAIASQAQAKSNDDMAANMNNIATQRNVPNVPQVTTPNVATGADAEQAALDKMKQKNPKLAGLMAHAGLDDNLDDVKPKSPPGFNAQNVMNMPGMKKQAAPVTAESIRFNKLNNLFESIVQEAGQQSISQYIMGFFKKFMGGKNMDQKALANAMPQAEKLAKEAEATYPKMTPALTKLAQLGWAVSHQQGDDAQQDPEDTTQQPTTPGSATPASTAQSGQTNAPAQTGSTTSAPVADPKKEQTVYAQVKGMLDKLDKKGKQRILAALEKSLGGKPVAAPTAPASTAPSAPSPSADAGANAFAQMGKQITQPGVTEPAPSTKTSTGGKVQQTGLGQVHTKSRANPNIKRRNPALAESKLDGSVWGLK